MNKRNKSFFSYVIPSVLAFALSGVYTITDGFFIGHKLGDVGLAASTLSYPPCAFIQAVGTGIGLAGAIRFAIYKAQENNKKEKECFTATSYLLILAGIILMGLFYILAKPIMSLLGAENEILELSVKYVKVISLGALFQVLATGFVPMVRNLGGSTFSMISMMLGFLTNIILDYLFVWVFSFGIGGAAWATVIGQLVTLLSVLGFFIYKKVRLVPIKINNLLVLWKKILKLSISPFGLTFSQTITLLLVNRFLLIHGDEHMIAVFGCIDYITTIIYLLLQGVGDGSQPLISNYYGEDDFYNVKKTRRKAYITALVLSIISMICLYIFRKKIGLLFGASSETNADVAIYLPYFLATIACISFVRITTAYFYATEKSIYSYLLVYIEPICILFLLLILPIFLGVMGVWIALPLSQFIMFIVALFVKTYVDKKTLSEENYDDFE